ncbi:YccS/YhfK family putative transporter [Yersinia ruckeri]|uniref:YccS/YhfK family putative transporter n=1 Tax=Yersinia ruckeri TaxID=29486 RepID=UPI0020BF1976|nr:YccS/YhfK family putative transporter [Yersinia ruckeri]MCW6526520.1 YccS/YhfK family putative transporter [Yersinia ruckeri]MCW6561796.1 YccS/YhfK family putative transporter [Yersinia ruckeri]UZY04996.1 YccS/YhfK family putative transporter [Yersinia ruckeri]
MWRRLIYHPEVNYALRQTLVLCLPVSIGLLFGDLQLGLLFALVPACCNIAGLDTPHKRFTKRWVIGGTLFALSSFLIQQCLLWHIPLPLIMFGLTLILGINGAISPLHARLLPAALVAAIFTLSMIGRFPIWHTPLLFIIGTAWYGLFTSLWFRLWKEQPMRETLSQLYRQLADYLEAKYSLLTQHIDPETALPPLLQRQQAVMDLINQLYQQLNMLPLAHKMEQKRLRMMFQVALDLQEHITVSLHQPEEVQKLVEQSHAEAVIRRNAQIIAHRLRVVADNILYHRHQLQRFTMTKELAALEKIAGQYPDNPVGQFCFYHFRRIARLLRNQRPLYRRELMSDQHRLPFWPALRSYLSFKSVALRNAGRLAVTLAIGSSLGMVFNLPKPYWILLTVMLVTQNGYNATRVRIQHRALGTVVGLVIAAGLLHLQFPENITLIIMLFITLAAYLVLRKNYGLAVIGLTITAVYTLQLLALNGLNFLVPRLIDTLIGCALAFGSAIWLWPQWQSGLLRKNAHQALENDQKLLQSLLTKNPNTDELAKERMLVNQSHNAVFTSLNQAMQEPGFNSRYLADMRLWVTHSQFIVEHINAMTILARDHYMLTDKLAEDYLQRCEIALQSCQQRLEYDGPSSENSVLQPPELHPDMPMTEMERHLRRILSHLSVMHTISSLAWRQRPHHGIWLNRKLRDS